MFGGKIIEAVGEKSRDLSDKLAEKYCAHLGEELLRREEKIIKREAAVEVRERDVTEREQKLGLYILVPKIYLQIPLLLILIVAVYLGSCPYT